jgi:hypothetical protein
MKRYGIAISFALGAALITACWDFAALLTPGEPPTPQEDAAVCIGSPLAEDCSNGIDDNANCLIDCKDPGCKWDRACRPDMAEDLAPPSDMGSDMPQG